MNDQTDRRDPPTNPADHLPPLSSSNADAGEPEPGGNDIWTVGHSILPIGDFLALLREEGIRCLVDVRTAPGSRRHPQFGSASLAGMLGDAGIAYEWRRELGGWRKARPESRHTALRSPSFRGYADHMESEEFRAALRWLIETARSRRTAVMCAESLWWRCHRRMLADALVASGNAVLHIVARGKREPHRLHPAARIQGEGLVYDVGTVAGGENGR